MMDSIQREHDIEELLELLRIVWQEHNVEKSFLELLEKYNFLELDDEEITDKLENIIESSIA